MSSVETHIGKLRKLDFLSNVNIEEWFKEKCNKAGISPIENDSWEDTWNFEHYNEPGFIVKVNNEYYEVIEDNDSFDDEDICFLNKNKDGTYDYVMQFYNGGICFPEMLTYGIIDYNNNLKRNQ